MICQIKLIFLVVYILIQIQMEFGIFIQGACTGEKAHDPAEEHRALMNEAALLEEHRIGMPPDPALLLTQLQQLVDNGFQPHWVDKREVKTRLLRRLFRTVEKPNRLRTKGAVTRTVAVASSRWL